MRNNETGEFELVIGNRQLLSGFFIVILLFAVFFAMGYILGQNSPGSAKMQAAPGSPAAAQESRPQPAAPAAAQPPAETGAASEPGAPATSDAGPAEAAPQPTTQPVREAAAGGSAAPPKTPSAPSTAAAATAPPANVPPPVEELPPGSYWQVRAMTRADAEIVVRTLREKGFPALMTPGPNNLLRVLVGPYADTQAMGRAKTELENAGFNNPIRR